MTNTEGLTVAALAILLTVMVALGAWLCFRRTRAGGFLLLGAVLILWTMRLGDTLLFHFVEQAKAGQKPALFPFSLMARGDQGWTGWQMPIGEFMVKFIAAERLLLLALLAASLFLIARSLRRPKSREQERQGP